MVKKLVFSFIILVASTVIANAQYAPPSAEKMLAEQAMQEAQQEQYLADQAKYKASLKKEEAEAMQQQVADLIAAGASPGMNNWLTYMSYCTNGNNKITEGDNLFTAGNELYDDAWEVHQAAYQFMGLQQWYNARREANLATNWYGASKGLYNSAYEKYQQALTNFEVAASMLH
jgi:hypothetical protein